MDHINNKYKSSLSLTFFSRPIIMKWPLSNNQCVRVCVCVCVCERERVCVRERERERESV